MKIIFMGTPEFAVPIVESISKVHEVVLVVTQPDTYNIKKKQMVFSPVKKWALENNVPLFQPEKIKKDYQTVLDIDVDLIVTAAYGQLIGDEVLEHPKYKCINVHGSILPKYRGGAPIQRAIINGESETGVSIIYMVKKMDAGDILRIEKIPITDNDNQDTIFQKLSILGSKIINEVIEEIEKGTTKPVKQNDDEVTFAYNLTKEDELIDFTKTSREVFNQIRGLNSNPTGYFILNGNIIKVYNSRVSEKSHLTKPGVILSINKDSFDISCAKGTVISITELKVPSKNRMFVRDFLNGQGRNLIIIGQEVNNGN